MNNKQYDTVGTFLKFYRQIIEQGKIDTPNT